MASDIHGLWEYTQNKQTHQFVIEQRDDTVHFRQELFEFGTIDEILMPDGEWFKVEAPHGRLRLKLLNDRMVTQFQRKDAATWSQPLLAKRMRVDVKGLFYQGGEDAGVNKRICTINERKIRWFSGQSCVYHYIGRSKIQIRLDGARYVAEIKDDGNLLEWSDGDIWIRKSRGSKNGPDKSLDFIPKKYDLRSLRPGVLRKNRNSIGSEPDMISSMETPKEKKPRSFSDADMMKAMTKLEQSDVNDRLAAAFDNRKFNQQVMEDSPEYAVSGAASKKVKNRPRARWDDENLAKNDSEKVPRIKIDEPPTPFEDIDEDEILAMSDHNLGNLPSGDNMNINLRHGANKILLSDPDFMQQMAKKIENARKEMEEEPDSNEDSEETRQKKFRERRSAHYNEGYIWKAVKQNPDFISGKEEIFE